MKGERTYILTITYQDQSSWIYCYSDEKEAREEYKKLCERYGEGAKRPKETYSKLDMGHNEFDLTFSAREGTKVVVNLAARLIR